MNDRQVTGLVVQSVHDGFDVETLSFVVAGQSGGESTTLRVCVDLWIDSGVVAKRSMYLVGGQVCAASAIRQKHTILPRMQIISSSAQR